MSHDASEVFKGNPLAEFSIDTLLAEVLRRQYSLFDERGFLIDGAFKLADVLGIRVCVDGVAARTNDQGEVELMAIRRNTGPYAGRLTLVGGGVGRVEENNTSVPESFEEALRRHFKTDLGFDDIEPIGSWTQPAYLAQDMRPVDGIEGEVRDGFTPNPASRHLVAARFLVTVGGDTSAPEFGSTTVGGQEASGIEWFTQANMPDAEQFGYGHHETYQAMFPIAQQALVANAH